MARPTPRPGWDPPGSNSVDPGSAKKLAGWLVGERPPAQWFNWLQEKFSEWIGFLDDQLQFGMLLGEGIVDTLGNATLLPRLDALVVPSSISKRTQLVRIRMFGVTGPYIHMWSYTTADGNLSYEITSNAEWDETNGLWTKRVSGQRALILRLISLPTSSLGALMIARKPSTDNAGWVDTYGDTAPTGWSDLIAVLGLLDGSSRLYGGLTVDSLSVTGSSLFTGAILAGDIASTGDINAASGLNRTEHRCALVNFQNPVGADPAVWDGTASLLDGVRYYHRPIRGGRAAGIVGWVDPLAPIPVGQALTLKMQKATTDAGPWTDLISCILTNASLHGRQTTPIGGGAFDVTDIIRIIGETADGLPLTAARDVGISVAFIH